MNKRALLEGNVYKALIQFAIPFLLANLLQVMYGATDLIVVGHFAGTSDVSAVSIGSQVMSMVTQLVLGISTGATVLLGHCYGAGRREDMAKTVGTAIWLFGGIAVFLTGLLLILRGGIISIMNTPAEAVGATGQYLLICTGGLVFIVAYNVISSLLRGLGDSRTPLLFVAVACVINIVLDVVLVDGFHMGAAGAATATVFAQACSVVFSFVFLKRRGLGFPFTARDVRFVPGFAARILGTGGPVGLQNGLVGISFLIITLIINRMGLVASAAVGVVEKLIEFLMLPSVAFSAAVAAMAAQNLGAGRADRARSCMLGAIGCSIAFGAAVAVFCQIDGSLLTGLFTSDPAVAEAAAGYLKTYSLDCVLVAIVFNMNGFFNGSGYAAFAMAHSLTATFLVRIPATMLLSRLEGVTLTTIGWAVPLSTLVSLLLCGGFFWRLGRKKNLGGNAYGHSALL